MNPAALVTILATFTTLGTASAAWQRISTAGDRPVDLACEAMPSTSVYSSDGIGKSGALLSDGATDVATIPAGRSEAVIQLSGQHLIDIATFVNTGAEGKVTLSGSTNGKDWTALGQNVFSAGERLVATNFAGSQVKFVQAVFELSNGGYISSFKIAGGLSTEDFSIGDATSNLVGGVGGARMIYVHPSPANVGEKEFDLNVVQFSKTQEKYRTVVYDLGAVRKVTSFSASYSASRPVRMQAFAFDQLPEQKDWRGKLTLDPAIFDEARPVATGEDARGSGMLKILPSKPVVAQYIAIRFEPNYQVASNGSQWSEFVAFAMAPYRQAGSVFTSESGSKLVAGDNGPPFFLYDCSLISSSGSGNGTFYAQYGSTNENQGGGHTENAPTYWPGGPGWFVGSPFGYLNRSLGGAGNNPFTPDIPNLNQIIANSRRGNVTLQVNPRTFVPIIVVIPETSAP